MEFAGDKFTLSHCKLAFCDTTFVVLYADIMKYKVFGFAFYNIG